MRPIKFRAWDGSFNKMERVTGLDYDTWNTVSVIRTDSGSECSKFLNPVWFALYELMQFTGLLDKNGKEIYEGDIIKFPDGRDDSIREVFYEGAEFQCSRTGIRHVSNVNTFCEVLGNIYENPELLTAKGDPDAT